MYKLLLPKYNGRVGSKMDWAWAVWKSHKTFYTSNKYFDEINKHLECAGYFHPSIIVG
jgi:hypothetical protein